MRGMSSNKSDQQSFKKPAGYYLLLFLRKEARENWLLLVAGSGLLGISGAALLAVVNVAASSASLMEQSPWLALVFVIFLVLQAGLQGFVLTRATGAVEAAICRVKIRVTDKLRRSSLRFIETHGGIATYAPLTQIGAISQGTVFLVGAAQVLLVLIFVFLYLAWLSPLSLLTILLILLICIPVLGNGYQVARELLEAAALAEGGFTRRFADLLNGFKEVRSDRVLSDGLMTDLGTSSGDALDSKTQAARRQVTDMNFSFSIFILMLFSVVFFVPVMIYESSEKIHQVATVVLSLNAPVGLLALLSPMLGQFDTSVSSLYALEKRLDQAGIEADGLSPLKELKQFESIELDDVRFQYNTNNTDETFGIGPLNLILHSGELLFIVGGNGSGKSTLMKLLTGLYQPNQGRVLLDGQELLNEDRPAYRTLFACVFTDFHLFEHLYNVEEKVVNSGLEELGLAKKTHYTDNGFTNLSLSTGSESVLRYLLPY